MIFHGGYSEIKLPKIISGKYAKDLKCLTFISSENYVR